MIIMIVIISVSFLGILLLEGLTAFCLAHFSSRIHMSDLTQQIESLQRQLKLASSEVDSLQAVECDLVKERDYLQTDNAKLVEERKTYIAKLKELEGTFRKSELLKNAMDQEKLNLEVSCLLYLEKFVMVAR